MDRETAQDIRGNLLAMWNVVQLWVESGDPGDAPLALELLRGLLGEVLQHYPAAVLFHLEFVALDDYLARAQESLPADGQQDLHHHLHQDGQQDVQAFMAQRLSVLVRAFDGIAQVRPAARVGNQTRVGASAAPEY